MSQRGKFLLLLALFTLPTVASFVAFYFLPPPAATSYGRLISPAIPLPEVALTRLDDTRDDLPPALRGKWLIVTREQGACTERCHRKLVAMRQARLVLGRDQDRVLRVVLVEDDVKPEPRILKEYDGTIWVSAKALPWPNLLPAPKEGDRHAAIYGVDPLGNVFIQYNDAPDIKMMANDLRRVLKASQIG